MRLRLVSVALAAGCVLGSAQESEAFIRWIHELSGPGPFGGVTLKLDCDPGGPCLWLVKSPDVREKPLRILFEPSFVWGDNTVGPGTAKLLSFEPGIEYWFFGDNDYVHLGLGGAFAYYRTFASGDGPNRNKVGASARVSLWLPDIADGWHPEVSLYGTALNTAFSSEEFGGPPGTQFERTLWGVLVGFRNRF